MKLALFDYMRWRKKNRGSHYYDYQSFVCPLNTSLIQLRSYKCDVYMIILAVLLQFSNAEINTMAGVVKKLYNYDCYQVLFEQL